MQSQDRALHNNASRGKRVPFLSVSVGNVDRYTE